MTSLENPRGYLGVLRDFPDFRRLYIARTISLLGDWFNLIALLALLRETNQNDPTLISSLYIVKLAPNFLGGLPAGVFADRYSRRLIMFTSDILRFFLTLCIFAALYFPAQGVLIVLGLSGLSVFVSAFFEPARTASIPNMVPRDDLATANALGAMTWSVMFTFGAGLGGVVTQFLGWRIALFLDAFTFLFSAWFIYRARIPQINNKTTRGNSFLELTGLRDLIEGARFVLPRPNIASLMLIKSGWGLGAGAVTFILTLYGQRIYQFGVGPDFGVSVMLVCRALGTGVGPLLARRLMGNDEFRIRLGIFCGFCMGIIFYIAFSLTHNPWLACLFVFCAHLGGSVVWVFSTVLLQQVAPDEFRGRIFSAELGLAMLFISGSIFLYGQLAEILALEILPLLIGACLIIPALFWGMGVLKFNRTQNT